MALKPENASVVLFDEKTGFEIAPELCTGCGLCQLSCTHIKKRVFAFEGAYITIDRVGTEEMTGRDPCISPHRREVPPDVQEGIAVVLLDVVSDLLENHHS